MVVDTMKKNRIMKITSGSRRAGNQGKLLLPFFLITAILLFPPKSLGSASEILMGALYDTALRFSEIREFHLEFILDFVADFVDLHVSSFCTMIDLVLVSLVVCSEYAFPTG